MKKYGYKIQAIAVIGCVGLSLILSRCSPLAPSGFKGIGSHGNSGLPGQQNNLNFVSIYQLDVSVLGNEVFDKTVATMPASQKAVELSQTLSPTQFQELQNTGHTDVQFATPPPKGCVLYFSVNLTSEEIQAAGLNSVQADLEQALGNSWHLVLTQSDATRTLMASMQGATLALSAAPSPAPPAPAPAPSPSPSPLASPSPSLVAKAG